jgi:hypothetical protein
MFKEKFKEFTHDFSLSTLNFHLILKIVLYNFLIENIKEKTQKR